MLKRDDTRFRLVVGDIRESVNLNHGSTMLLRSSNYPWNGNGSIGRDGIYDKLYISKIVVPYVRNLLLSIFGDSYCDTISCQLSLACIKLDSLAEHMPDNVASIVQLFNSDWSLLGLSGMNGGYVPKPLERLAMDGCYVGFQLDNADVDIPDDPRIYTRLVTIARVVLEF